MTQTKLDALLDPRSVALIGGGGEAEAVTAAVAANLRLSADAGFGGRLMAIGSDPRTLGGLHTCKDIASLPEAPDLALVCTPTEAAPPVIEQLGRRGARAAVLIAAGLGEHRAGGDGLRQRIRSTAAARGLRLVGPSSLGILVPGIALSASLAHRMPPSGNLAFVAQSGAIVTSVIDWAAPRGIGFSHLISLGDMADVELGEVLDYLAGDPKTRGILLYVEAIYDARRFMSAARAASRMKPIILVKAGRHPEGARAVASHTGFMAGTDAVYDAAFRRAGILRVQGLTELFDAAEVLAQAKPPRGDRMLILTNSGGMAALAADELIAQGGRLAELPADKIAALDTLLPGSWSWSNPVDISGDAGARRYAEAMKILSEVPDVDALAVLYCPTALSSSNDVAEAVLDSMAGASRRLLLTSWVGDETVRGARRRFAEQRIPSYDTPEQAVRAFMYLVRYRQSQRLLTETPPSLPEDYTPETARVRSLIDAIDAADLERRDGWLTEVESKQILSAYGIPTVPTRLAETPEAAAALAAEIGGPVALKLVSPGLVHKSAAGAVALDLQGPAAVEREAAAMAVRVAARRPELDPVGFSVQPMVHRPGAYELILGVADDAQFGPVLMAGHGGTRTEVIDDTAVGLPPMNMRLARELLSRTRIHRLLEGDAGQPGVNLDAVALVLVRLSQLVCDIAEVRELDINPLLVDAYGVIALDARIRVARTSDSPGDPGDRLAIRPYPTALEETIPLGDGRRLLLRPIRPEDEPALQDAITKLTPEEVRLRFFAPMRTLDHMAAARFTQLDYDREMALVLTDPGVAGLTEIYAVVSLSADPESHSGEYAVLVRHDMSGMGLGILLVRRIIDYARSRGIREIVGDVLQENRTMLKLCKLLGFSLHRDPDDPEIVKVRLRLDTEG